MVLKMNNIISKSILKETGSQWSAAKIGVKCSYFQEQLAFVLAINSVGYFGWAWKNIYCENPDKTKLDY